MIALLVSWVVLFTPESGVPTAPPGTDKVVHLTLFAALAITGRIAGARTSWLLASLTAYAALSEVLQGVLPLGRSCELLDAVVDVAGALLGWALLAIHSATRRERR
ncbi:VanZ family protein [Saccharopolyspora dendranthemae]|uniref:VanZ like protein n=1 Tax=Saccharopolyspora dendranthemae TaxID=1181886 RepID=A0A561VAQ3_9PSEU|nr:VanZ family protein [Saccharopolyspora dendranthemae]TWG08698.1 VanZ like protein [Saccharopolyspora dendranthemae]